MRSDSPPKMRAPKKPKVKRPFESLQPQQKSLVIAGQAWNSMSEAQKLKFDNKFFNFMRMVRVNCPDYLNIKTPEQMKACITNN